MMYDGVRTYFTKEAEHALHGRNRGNGTVYSFITIN